MKKQIVINFSEQSFDKLTKVINDKLKKFIENGSSVMISSLSHNVYKNQDIIFFTALVVFSIEIDS